MAITQIPKISVQRRDTLGTRTANRVRKVGRIPGVIYGHGQNPVHVTLDRREITDLLHKNTHVLEAVVDSAAEPCLVKDVQWDHLGSNIVHIDLARVNLQERVTVEVGLELTGEAIGLKEAGAILEHPIDRIEIEALVTQIPDVIRVDVSALGVGDSIQAKDIKLPEGVTTTLDPNTTIASISIVSETAAAPVAVEGAATEPEVIGKKVEEGEEAADAAKKDKK